MAESLRFTLCSDNSWLAASKAKVDSLQRKLIEKMQQERKAHEALESKKLTNLSFKGGKEETVGACLTQASWNDGQGTLTRDVAISSKRQTFLHRNASVSFGRTVSQFSDFDDQEQTLDSSRSGALKEYRMCFINNVKLANSKFTQTNTVFPAVNPKISNFQRLPPISKATTNRPIRRLDNRSHTVDEEQIATRLVNSRKWRLENSQREIKEKSDLKFLSKGRQVLNNLPKTSDTADQILKLPKKATYSHWKSRKPTNQSYNEFYFKEPTPEPTIEPITLSEWSEDHVTLTHVPISPTMIEREGPLYLRCKPC